MFKYVGRGRGRVVFQISNNEVIKIPYNEDGIEQNRNEYRLYLEGGNPYYAEVTNYNSERDYEYMEYVIPADEYFEKYVYDKIHCSVYDVSTEKKITFRCDGHCENCKYNTLNEFIPNYIDDMLEHNPKDRIQVGKNNAGEFKFYDYSGTMNKETDEFIFDERMVESFIEYYNSGSTELFKYWFPKHGHLTPVTPEQQQKRKDRLYRRANMIKRRIYHESVKNK